MDIYSAETHVKKLLSYVEGLANDPSHRMYTKSKDRLKDLAVTCSKVVQVISDILQDEMLQDGDDEFGINSSNVQGVLQSMESQMAQLCQLAQPQMEVKHESSRDITTSVRKRAIYTYRSVLSQMATKDTPYAPVKECSIILWSWFKARFIENYNPSFHYNIKRFPEWVCDIVILYSYSLESGTVDSFMAQFRDWIESLYSDPENIYAVPFEVYKFSRNTDKKKLTLTAAILWDVLLSHGLSDLCDVDDSGLYPRENLVYQLCDRINPDVLNDYEHPDDHPEILIKCHIQEGTN